MRAEHANCCRSSHDEVVRLSTALPPDSVTFCVRCGARCGALAHQRHDVDGVVALVRTGVRRRFGACSRCLTIICVAASRPSMPSTYHRVDDQFMTVRDQRWPGTSAGTPHDSSADTTARPVGLRGMRVVLALTRRSTARGPGRSPSRRGCCASDGVPRYHSRIGHLLEADGVRRL